MAIRGMVDDSLLRGSRMNYMPMSLLATKLYIPAVRPDLVPRQRLIERLDEGVKLGRKLTLISAPAGFGKTTLLGEWIAATGGTFAWVSLDKGDNDPARFFAYLLAALRSVDEKIGQGALQMLRAAQTPPAERLLTALINDIATTAIPQVLVLDDYHTITELAIHEAVSFLLERQPPQIHLAITTRQDPPLPLSRLRGRSQMTEIRKSDLRFTAEEAAAFLNSSMGLQLAPSEIDALEARTEGWITGLQLAALSMQGRDREGIARFIDGFSGRYHFVLDYLTDEVLQRQPQPVQTFLLQTSILERMCDSLCDALLAGEDGKPEADRPRLEQLEAANLFTVSLDDELRWYRYHRLFAELLRARLQEIRPDLIPELHCRAAAWYEHHGFSQDAVYHALASGDHDLAADTIERAIISIPTWRRADAALMLKWLQALPDAVVEARPNLRLFASRTLYVSGQVQAAEDTLAKLESWLENNPSAPDAARLRGLVAVDRASYAAVLGNVQQAKELARQALAHVAQDDPIAQFRAPAILGMACLRAGDVSEAHQAFSQAIDIAVAADLNFAAVPFLCNLAETQIVQGRLRQAWQSCKQAQALSTAGGKRFFASGFVGLQLSKLLYEWNDLPGAERHLLDGLELLNKGGISEGFGSMHAILAQIKQAQGDAKAALEAAQEAVELVQQETIPRLTGLTTAYLARIWLAQGNLEAAGRWACDFGQAAGTEYLREFEELTLVRVLLAEARPSDALDLLDSLLPPAQAAGRRGAVLEIYVLRALACQALNDKDASLAALEQALTLGEPEGYVRLFVDCGEPMRALLKQAATRGLVSGYVSQLLAAFPLPDAQDTRPAPSSQPLVEPLTGRELEVLELLAQGLANREIGRRLFISLPTVKSHTSSIYGKLGVHSRDEAVARARALGLLASP